MSKAFTKESDEEDDALPRPDEDDDEEEREEDALARAVALFDHAPPDVARLLALPIPRASARRPNPKEPQMPEPIAVDTKAFEARFTALTERAEAAEKIHGELLAITGKATAGEALALVAGLKEKALKADDLAAQLAKFEAEKRAGQVAALLDTASREGRLTPAKREELMKADAPAFARDPGQLKVFLDCLQPVVVPAAAPKHEEPKDAPEASLTEDEKHFAAQLKLDPAKVAAFKLKK